MGTLIRFRMSVPVTPTGERMFEVTGKRALVTDGSAGIGLGMARGLARADADVALWGRDPGRLETAASGLAKFAESTTEDHRKAMGTNLDGGYFTLRETTKTLVAQGTGGSVIVTSSLGAHEGAGRNQAYGASKAGVLALANGARSNWRATVSASTACCRAGSRRT